METQACSASASCDARQQTTQPGKAYATIGEIASEFNVSLRTLRFYENRDLLHPLRKGMARLYSQRDRLHLKMILKGRQLGFTLSEIHDILANCGDLTQAKDLELALHPDQISAQIRHLERRRSDLEAALAELRRAQERVHEAMA